MNQRQRSGDGSLAKKPYLYTANLQFLRPIMETRPTVDNLSQDPVEVEAASGPSSSDNPSAPPSVEETPPLATVTEDAPENIAVPQQINTQRHASGRRRGPPPPDSALDTRTIVESRVMEYLNQNRGESPDETMVKSLVPLLKKVPEERKARCLSAVALLMDLKNQLQRFTIWSVIVMRCSTGGHLGKVIPIIHHHLGLFKEKPLPRGVTNLTMDTPGLQRELVPTVQIPALLQGNFLIFNFFNFKEKKSLLNK
ncbi:uncharacterized protein LOC122930727 [Bufo gargarizans]|uniref:uncharacterized protein LOC122930727 n=1 Tax=Bufo gargarizans TaxID=30331 RepID=UPI001CF29010|nr:uncharacterized protein LOC122930727 [Bufo gargarizans]